MQNVAHESPKIKLPPPRPHLPAETFPYFMLMRSSSNSIAGEPALMEGTGKSMIARSIARRC
jgi:hypothetical protein